MKKPPAKRTWTDRDSALWHTCEIAVDVANGRQPAIRQQIVATFPPQLAADERYLAEGPFELLEEIASGDGSYLHNGGFFFATGRSGLAMTAGIAAVRAAGNARRRREAQEAATLRWHPTERGGVFVSVYGLTHHTARGLFCWDWASIIAAEMVGPGAMHMFAHSRSGQIAAVLRSDWAELAFLLWAFARHPAHPQLISGGWLPPGWLQWCAEQEHPTRLRTPAITR